MGFRTERRAVRLEFGNPALAGLEVRAEACTEAEYRMLVPITSAPEYSLIRLYAARRFAGRLVSWNIVDAADEPVPMTFEGLSSLEPWLVDALLFAWRAASAPAPMLLQGLN